ncbi:MAG: hypothetical protein BM557_00720 [Flavobacterium sp. MedPE-SWcel]|nr:MAG: hypothetical protein BM557_00720 [Flavobacterium sp. MedPE-SWcel]
MEPNNIEQEFKNKLEERTIQSSGMAWDRLDAMLTVAEEKKKKKPKRTWIYIAASFLGFLLVGTLLLKQEKGNDIIIDDTEIVTTIGAEEPVKQHDDKEVLTAPSIITESVNNTIVMQNSDDALVTKEITNNNLNPIVQKSVVNSNDINEITLLQNNIASATVLESNNSNKPSGVTVDAEALLASVDVDRAAQIEMDKINITTTPSVDVDANSLLSSVEGELNESFRSRVMHSVVKGYKKVKTAVVNRNHKEENQ